MPLCLLMVKETYRIAGIFYKVKLCFLLYMRKQITHDDFTCKINYIFSTRFRMPSTCSDFAIVDSGFKKHPKSYDLVPTSQIQFLFITQ